MEVTNLLTFTDRDYLSALVRVTCKALPEPKKRKK